MFSTNLDPKDLVDDAFLRRMRHKVEIQAPQRDDLREDLQRRGASKLGMNPCPEAVEYLYERYYIAGPLYAGQRLPRFTGDGAVDLPISKTACPVDARSHGRSRRELHPRIQIGSEHHSTQSRRPARVARCRAGARDAETTHHRGRHGLSQSTRGRSGPIERQRWLLDAFPSQVFRIGR